MTQKQERLFSAMPGICLALSVLLVAKQAVGYAAGRSVSAFGESGKPRLCVVIDAGHGGNDPGKVGINDALEKDVNLQIALLVRQFLEADDIGVIMTREDDVGLYDADASNKKVQDMKRRIALIEESDAALVVSIHQNSYQEEYVHGAQVFFYAGSDRSQKLAERIQSRLVEDLDPDNHRRVKANDSYYLLKKTGKPIVIVECGFLSNSVEAEKLVSPWYQEKVAWAIHLGIIQYLNETDG